MSSFVAFLLSALLLVPALLIAIPVHEMGHAVAAYFLGDRSVRYFGYLSLNPRRFLDPLGAIAVFVALVGWGRRVPVQPNRISTTRQRVIHELGGPAAELGSLAGEQEVALRTLVITGPPASSVLAASEGLVVTPSTRPEAANSRISATSAVSRNIFMVLSSGLIPTNRRDECIP